jgi:glycosyltransferase involved in cell wall biosynthesis
MHICFSCRGNKADELRNAVTSEDTNISFMNFVEEHLLEDHLNAADIHLISLKKDWSGLVIPSKFFGSLALGKPVIYAGPGDSAIAEWIKNHKIGFHLTKESLEEVAMRIETLAYNTSGMNALRKRAFSTYHSCFSKKIVVDQWDHLMRALLAKHDKMGG